MKTGQLYRTQFLCYDGYKGVPAHQLATGEEAGSWDASGGFMGARR